MLLPFFMEAGMAKAIWKQEIKATQRQYSMPKGAEILCVQTQNDQPHIWFMCDPQELSQEQRTFIVVGTGQWFDGLDIKRYIGTFQMREGSLVFHLFETGK